MAQLGAELFDRFQFARCQLLAELIKPRTRHQLPGDVEPFFAKDGIGVDCESQAEVVLSHAAGLFDSRHQSFE